MGILRFLGVSALVSTSFVLGCTEPEPMDDGLDDLDAPPVKPMEGNSSGGTNGGPTNAFILLENQVVASTDYPLVDPGTTNVNTNIANILLAQPSGTDVFKYAVRCGLTNQGAYSMLSWGTYSFVGMRHLSTTGGWLTGALPAGAKRDLLACMAAHMNPYGVEVPLLLSGANIYDDGVSYPDYTVEEALWVVDIIASTPHYTVWPTDNYKARCAADPEVALEKRVCGQHPDECEFTMGTSIEDDCDQDPTTGHYTCNGQPAILTTLKEADFIVVNQRCLRP